MSQIGKEKRVFPLIFWFLSSFLGLFFHLLSQQSYDDCFASVLLSQETGQIQMSEA